MGAALFIFRKYHVSALAFGGIHIVNILNSTKIVILVLNLTHENKVIVFILNTSFVVLYCVNKRTFLWKNLF